MKLTELDGLLLWDVVDGSSSAGGAGGPAAAQEPDGVSDHAVGSELEVYLEALIQGDRETCWRIVEGALAAGLPVGQVYEGLLKPALYRVGELWAQNRISVACEHLATAITEGLLVRVYPRVINPVRAGRKVLLATVEDELHEIGLKMAGDIFEMCGWDTRFARAGLRAGDLLELIGRERPDLLGLSFSVYFHLDRLVATLQRIRAEHPGLPVLVGGQGLTWGGRDEVAAVPGVTCIDSLAALTDYLRSGLPRGPA